MSDCIFCKVKTNELPIKKIAENKYAIAFLDAFPITPGHCLVIPKDHYDNLAACSNEVLHDMMDLTKIVVQKLEDLNAGIQGFNYLSNHGKIAGQVVMHCHLHIIPKYSKDSGFTFSHTEQKSDPTLETKIKSLIIE